MKNIFILSLIIILSSIAIMKGGSYNGANKGIYVDINKDSYGFEYYGDVGFFHCTLYDGEFTC